MSRETYRPWTDKTQQYTSTENEINKVGTFTQGFKD